MKNIIPPPIVLLLFGIAMWFVAHSEFAYPVAIPYALAVAIVIAAAGITVGDIAGRFWHFREDEKSNVCGALPRPVGVGNLVAEHE